MGWLKTKREPDASKKISISIEIDEKLAYDILNMTVIEKACGDFLPDIRPSQMLVLKCGADIHKKLIDTGVF